MPGRFTGPPTLESSEADLRRRFGRSSVDSSRIQIGEGETMVEILWQDTVQRRRPARLILRGSKSQWQVGRGILYLDPGPAQYQSAAYSQVLGDRDYSSALPPMQQLAPRVAQIFVDFE